MASWTPPEIAYLRRHHGGLSEQSIAAALGRSRDSVRSQANRLELEHRGPSRWSARERFYLRSSYGRLAVAEIAAELGRSEGAVQLQAGHLGLLQHPRWTPLQKEYLAVHYGRMTCAAIGGVLGRTERAVQGQALIMELPRQRSKTRVWTDAEIRFLERSYKTMRASAVARRLGRTDWQVWHKAAELGISKRPAISAEAEAVLWELRDVDGVEEYFALEFGIGLPVVRRALAQLRAEGGPSRPVGNLPAVELA